jgi:fucose permease
VVTPVCLLILAEELDFSLTGGGGIEVARTTLLLAVLLISGLAAARWGKVRVLGCGSLILATGMLAYAVAPTYGVVLLAAGMLGVGGGVLEALINPLVQDLHPDDSGRYLNLVNGFWSVGVLTTVLVVGELLTRGVSWRLIMGGTGVLGLLPAALFLYHLQAAAVPAGSTTQAVAHIRDVLRVGRVWHYMVAMFFCAGAEGAFTFWTASYAQLHYGGLPRAGGFGTACFAGGMVVGRFASAHMVGQGHLRRLIVGSAVAGVVISLFVPLVGSLDGLYALLFFVGLSVACLWPSIQSYAAERLQVDSTMLLILLACAGIAGISMTSWVMGWIGDRAGLDASFLLPTGMFAMVIAAMLTDRMVFERREARE